MSKRGEPRRVDLIIRGTHGTAVQYIGWCSDELDSFACYAPIGYRYDEKGWRITHRRSGFSLSQWWMKDWMTRDDCLDFMFDLERAYDGWAQVEWRDGQIVGWLGHPHMTFAKMCLQWNAQGKLRMPAHVATAYRRAIWEHLKEEVPASRR